MVKKELLEKAKEIEKRIVKKGEKAPEIVELPDILLFGKWSSKNIELRDPGLKDYINLKPVYIPKTFGRHATQKFHKSKYHIIERLMNHVPVSGHKGKKQTWCTGKQLGQGITLLKIVRKTLELIEEKTKQNPIQVVVRAVENAAPCEEVTTVQYGGIRHPKAIETSPQRRIDLALRWICQGAKNQSKKSKKHIWDALAEEIIAASKEDPRSFSVAKRIEAERQAAASR